MLTAIGHHKRPCYLCKHEKVNNLDIRYSHGRLFPLPALPAGKLHRGDGKDAQGAVRRIRCTQLNKSRT